jgi:probable HAF family extracellular repeat protein
MKQSRLPIYCAIAILFFSPQLQAAPRYTITDLGDLPGGADYSVASGINNLGQVVGWSGVLSDTNPYYQISPEAVDHGFLWSAGTIKDLGTGFKVSAQSPYSWVELAPIGIGTGDSAPTVTPEPLTLYRGGSYARAINDAGQIVLDSGRIPTASMLFVNETVLHQHQTYIWEQGAVTGLDTMWSPAAINGQGTVVGSLSDGRPVRWTAGQIEILPELPRTAAGNMHFVEMYPQRALAINEAGDTVGYSNDLAALWQANGEVVDLQVSTPPVPSTRTHMTCPPGAYCLINTLVQPNWDSESSRASAINDLGMIAGMSSDGNFLITSEGVVRLDNFVPTDLNNNGWIVGYGAPDIADSPSGRIAKLWPPDAGALVLDQLIPSESGWSIFDAAGINDQGQIAATGLRDGVTHALLLTPVPEPEAYAMMLAGLVLVAFAVRRTKQKSS